MDWLAVKNSSINIKKTNSCIKYNVKRSKNTVNTQIIIKIWEIIKKVRKYLSLGVKKQWVGKNYINKIAQIRQIVQSK